MAKTILIADDEEMIRCILGQYLRKEGYRVILSENGEQALKVFKHSRENQYPIEIVVTDMKMPKGDGYFLTEKIREIDPNMPIIMTSGTFDDAAEEKAYQTGVNVCLRKPFSNSDLAATIELLQQG